MVDREKVIMGFTRHIDTACEFCPYDDSNTCTTDLCKDVLELLKEQQETIASFQSTICKLNAALGKQPEIIQCENCQCMSTSPYKPVLLEKRKAAKRE